MPRFTTVRQRHTEMVEGVTPWEYKRANDEPWVIRAFSIPDQSFAKGSLLHIETYGSSGELNTSCVWPVEEAVERMRAFGLGPLGLKEVVEVLRSAPEAVRAVGTAMTLASAMNRLADALDGSSWGLIVLPVVILVAPREVVRITVTGDPENRPIRVRLAGIVSSEVKW